MKMNALLDYGTSSSESDLEEEKPQEKPMPAAPELPKPKLPKPALGESALQTSVFSNPFVEAELAKAAILEKHVKMVPGKNETQMINGKKICWNYRKGRCRFGHKCKYAHDSDIQKSNEELDEEKKKLNTVVCEGSATQSSVPPPQVMQDLKLPTDDDLWEGGPERKKRRPGLSKGLVPGKKVLQMYREQRKKDHKNS